MSEFLVAIINIIRSMNFKPFGDQKVDEARAKVNERIKEQHMKDIDYWTDVYFLSRKTRGLEFELSGANKYSLEFWEEALRNEICSCDKCGHSLKRNKPE